MSKAEDFARVEFFEKNPAILADLLTPEKPQQQSRDDAGP